MIVKLTKFWTFKKDKVPVVYDHLSYNSNILI